MKIIELLNKIANGEEAPKKVRYNDEIYDTEISNNFSLMIYEATGNMSDDGEVRLFLNDEVEIIEEDKEIKKLNLDKERETIGNEQIRAIDYLLEAEINNLIDKIKSLENKQ